MGFKLPTFINKIHGFLDGIHLPMLGISLWKLFDIYVRGIFHNKVLAKASAISWSFFLSLFPFLLFLLSVLPYLPHYDKLQFYIFEVLMHNIFPSHMHADVTHYIQNNIIPNMKSISNFTIVFALIFATNGTFSIINGFNEHTEEKRSDIYEYILSFFITLGFIGITFLALFGVYYSEVVLKLFTPQYNISWFVDNLSKIIGFVSFPLFYFLLLTLFYWVGTARIVKFRQAIPGAFFTTVIFIITTYFFAVYVSRFARYNVLYGSIGSIILLMVWVNVNVILLLFGNELNLAIRKLRKEKLIADEMKHEIEDFQKDISEIPQTSSEHTIVLDADKKS